MFILEKTVQISRRSFNRVVTNTFEDRLLQIRLSNGTRSPIRFVKKLQRAGSITVSFTELCPGEAGTVEFSSAEGTYFQNASSGCHHAGAVELEVGTARVFFGEHLPIGQSFMHNSRFGLEFAASNRTIKEFYCGLPHEFMGTPGVASSATSPCGSLHVRVIAVSRVNPVEIDVVVLEDYTGELEYDLDTSQQLEFAEWCGRNAEHCLGHAIYLTELGAITRAVGLRKLALVDKAFALDLLICTFVTSEVLGKCVDSLAMNLERWHQKRPPNLSFSEEMQYAAYAGLKATAGELMPYIDAAHLLLRATAVISAGALRDAMASCKSRGEWPASSAVDVERSSGMQGAEVPSEHPPATLLSPRPPQAVSSPATETKSPEESHILAEFLRDRVGHATLASSQTESFALDLKGSSEIDVNVLPNLVRHTIHYAAANALRHANLLKSFELQQDKTQMMSVIRRFRDWSPLSQRRFLLSAGADKQRIHVESFCHEVMGNLEGGAFTSPLKVLESLGAESGDYDVMSTNSKSGEFFFFSSDRRFIIKTVSRKECVLLAKFMPAYQYHFRCWPRSFIVKFAGLYYVEIPGRPSIYFVVMLSVFDPSIKVHETFDLKGSSYHRQGKKGDRILKDSDWKSSKRRIKLSSALTRDFCAIHEADVQLLLRFKMMDYSLLVAIHHIDSPDPVEKSRVGWRAGGGIFDKDGTCIYFVGIIDFSIKYSLKKESETLLNAFKGVSEKASCVSQELYASRQIEFVRENVVEKFNDDIGTLGRLRVDVISGQGLRVADITGTSDPYVVVKLGLASRRTQTIKRNLNPQWNATLFLPVHTEHTSQSVEFTVWDEDRWRSLRGSDDFLGKLDVPLSSALEQPCRLADTKLLKTTTGSLSIRLSFELASRIEE
eukprot:TRINITY_DN62388_c0_g1_i1.p1 TRINITY_DN62388_c0_g1~~TRINITY_DN62388_c0_g1_i1.p1  ORF type:complete len:931 (+),score=103.17 TRINITY_DN62388_c0_g1_i1:118-2793(+)